MVWRNFHVAAPISEESGGHSGEVDVDASSEAQDEDEEGGGDAAASGAAVAAADDDDDGDDEPEREPPWLLLVLVPVPPSCCAVPGEGVGPAAVLCEALAPPWPPGTGSGVLRRENAVSRCCAPEHALQSLSSRGLGRSPPPPEAAEGEGGEAA